MAGRIKVSTIRAVRDIVDGTNGQRIDRSSQQKPTNAGSIAVLQKSTKRAEKNLSGKSRQYYAENSKI